MDCPNCITPWKCNGPHLLKGSEHHYKSIDGYYVKQPDTGVWLFFPFEKGLDSQELLDIANTLRNLNETRSELTDTI